MTPTGLEITFNHFDVERLAANLVSYSPQWRALQRSFPVTLDFAEVSELHEIRLVENFVLQKIRATSIAMRSYSRSVSRIILLPSSGGEFALLVDSYSHGATRFKRRNAPKDDSYAHGWTTCVACKHLNVTTDYHNGWAQVFGKEALIILERFDRLWPVNDWYKPDFEQWLDREFSPDLLHSVRANGLKFLSSR